MSRRARGALAPSLFPFLAVLLCTMGSLVLILMLMVSGASATANKAITKRKQKREELESDVRRATLAFHRQLEEGRVELEKQRLVLEHYEEHILELMEELERLELSKDLLTEDSSSYDAKKTLEEISELEKQLLAATEELEQQVDESDGDKPVFAIIPYQGPNGTHRRPIYLECDEAGIKIQPEGVRLSLEDLRPPHGPGNPLDAALRTIRAEYKPANGAVTHTAYPLVVVRPSGIRSYALARGALKSWDEQFGYELISEELELVFPNGQVGLKDKIVKAVDLAKQRQAALVMAMPRRYQNRNLSIDRPPQGSFSPHGNSSPAQNLSVPERGPSESSNSPFEYFGSSKGGLGSRNGNSTQNIGSLSSRSSPQATGYAGSEFNAARGGFERSQRGSQNASTTNPSDPLVGSNLPGDGSLGTETSDSLADRGGDSYFGDLYNRNQLGPAGDAYGADVATGLNDSNNSKQAGNSEQRPQDLANGEGSSPYGGGGSSSSSSSGGSMNASATASVSNDQDQQSPSAPSLNLNMDFNNSKPVAESRGRNWAWSPKRTSRTAVVRSIRMQCLENAWVLLPDKGTRQKPITITHSGSPQQRVEQLVQHISQRVKSWGIALAGGDWKPELVITIGPNAEWRFRQLQTLMQGSGIEMRVKTLQAKQPSSNSVPR